MNKNKIIKIVLHFTNKESWKIKLPDLQAKLLATFLNAYKTQQSVLNAHAPGPFGLSGNIGPIVFLHLSVLFLLIILIPASHSFVSCGESKAGSLGQFNP